MEKEHTYSNLSETGTNVHYANCSMPGSSDERLYDEVCPGEEPVYSNSEIDVTASTKADLSLQAGASHQLFREKSKSCIGLQAPNVEQEDVSRSYMRSISNPRWQTASQIADELKKRQLSPDSATLPSVILGNSDALNRAQKLVYQPTDLHEDLRPPPYSRTANPTNPFLDTSDKTEAIKAVPSASNASVPFGSANTHLRDASTSVGTSAPIAACSSVTGLKRLPRSCVAFAAKADCQGRACADLHVCGAWLSGRCPLLRRCRRPHSLSTAHNLTVLRARGWVEGEVDAARRWLSFRAGCERVEAAGLPPICMNHARGDCRARPCDALHMCPRFLVGVCEKKTCSLGHELFEVGNNRLVVVKSGNGDVPAKKLLKKIAARLEV